VDTFGLCSFDDPVKALNEMRRVCKDDGQILLLEHGRSHYDWLNRVLDVNSQKHTEKWGCIWNRDISEIVEEVGLEVKSSYRVHFGTTYYITASPRKAEGVKCNSSSSSIGSGRGDASAVGEERQLKRKRFYQKVVIV